MRIMMQREKKKKKILEMKANNIADSIKIINYVQSDNLDESWWN